MTTARLSSAARRARIDQVGSRRPPALLIPPAAVGALFLLLPTVGLLVRMPWSGLREIFRTADVTAALRLSLYCSTWSAGLSLVFGVPLGWVLARARLPGLGILRAAVTLPLVLPPVAGGVALFLAFGRLGIVGQYLDRWFGFTLPFTTTGVIVAETFVAMPFMVVTIEGGFRGVDRGIEEAAATLGASRLRIFTRVTLPAIVPSLVAGAVLSWARALGEFGATITFNGSLPGVTETMPIAISQALDTSPQAAEGLSLVMLVIAVVDSGRSARQVVAAGGECLTRACGSPAPYAGARSNCGSTSRSRPVRSWPSSARTAPGSRPCCARWPVCIRCQPGDRASAAACSMTRPRGRSSSRRPVGSASSSRTVGSSGTCASSTTSRSVFGRAASTGRRPEPRPANGSRHWVSATCRGGARASCPAARRNGSPSPGRSSSRPDYLLLDEPFAALDVLTRSDVQGELRQHLAQYPGPTVLVTHDLIDALVLAQRIVVIQAGRVVQVGTPAEITSRPATAYVAKLVGVNLYGSAPDGRLVDLASSGPVATSAVLVAVRPTAIAVALARPTDTGSRYVWPGRVAGLSPLADRVRVEVAGSPTAIVDLTAASVAELGLATGVEVWLSAELEDLVTYSATAD